MKRRTPSFRIRSVALCMVAFAIVGASAEVPEAARVLPGEYAEGGAGAARPLPAAWGVHFAQGETQGWKFAWLRVSAQASGTVSVSVNRLFEPIAPEKPDDLAPASYTPQTFAVSSGVNWLKVPISCLREMRFEVSCDGVASCDAMLLVKDESFDPAALTPEEIESIPRRAPRTEFADALFERNPLTPLREYAEAVARHWGVEPRDPAPTHDANGAALYGGKPFFPMMMYHTAFNDDECLLADVPLNVFGDRTPGDPSPFPRLLMDAAVLNRDWSYNEFFAVARGEANGAKKRRTAILYLADEPDGAYDAIGLRRLHELAKIAIPDVPTCYCFCTFGAVASDKSRTCDFPCADHYPIGTSQPWYSVQSIGWMVDKARLHGGNAPSFFCVQIHDLVDQSPYEGGMVNPAEGGFPTERELAAMTFLPVAHGARGLFFYNFREIHGEDRKSMPVRSPESWANVTNLIMQLHVMEPALVGPEVRMPWTVSGEGSVRLLVSEDLQMGYLVVVNPTLHAITQRLAPSGANPLAGTKYREICNYGVTASFAQDGVISFAMEELGCALYRLLPEGLSELERRPHEEIMEELRERSRIGPVTDEATRLGRRGQKRPAAPERAQHFERDSVPAAPAAAMVVGDENAETAYLSGSTVVKVTQSGTLTVTEPGEIEVLLVGGGGGAGGNLNTAYNGGGGGGGGVVHRRNLQVAVGDYPIAIGLGGPVNSNGNHWSPSKARGGDTTGFGFTALGGGPGALGGGWGSRVDGIGASGGGGATDGGTTIGQGLILGGTALASAENGNLGNRGADAATDPADSSSPAKFNPGGGGGAGAAGSGVIGGDGYACDITGRTVWYGGGGAGGKKYYGGTTPKAGKGGGNANYGGGGSAASVDGTPETGGPGVVIVSFARTERIPSSDFAVSGDEGHGWRGRLADGYRFIAVTNGTTLHVTGSATPDILLVGGGGGGGKNDSGGEMAGGGGGAGGLIHVKSFPLAEGDYPVTIGPGGDVFVGSNRADAMGGNSTAFGLTAYGGGFGAHAGGPGFWGITGSGGSGGGGSRGWSGDATAAGTQSAAATASANCGNAGFTPTTSGQGGGGGGAGGPASGGTGGVGYECDITWENVFYGGGGYAGNYYAGNSGQFGGGRTNYGGGGHKGQTGGPGILVIRYKAPATGTWLVIR